jgi:PAS domain S-box-containing protein
LSGDGGPTRRDPDLGEVSEAAARLDPHAILESIPEPVGLVDRQGRLLGFNAPGRAVILAVRGQAVALGADLYSFMSDHNVPGVKESLARAFRGEAHAHRTTAAGRHFETVYSPVRGPDGEVAFVSIRVADVTEREQALAELAALNATLEERVAQRGEEVHVILSSTHDGFAMFEHGGRFAEMNDAYCRLAGYSRDELLGMNIRDVDVGLTHEQLVETGARMRESGSASFESRYRRKDGRIVDIDATVNWENVNGGRYIAFVRDITARKEAEAVRDRQLEILEATPDLVGMADDERRLFYLNPAGRRLLGIDSIEEVRVDDLHPTWFLDRLERQIAPAARRGEVWQGEAVLKARDGREIPVLQVVVPHVRPDGSVPYYSTVAHDITEQKRAEAEREERATELARLNEDLARAGRAKDEFLASMSHELRTPLTGILGAAELLRVGVHGGLNERQARTLGILENAGRHLLSLLSDILDVARIGAGRLTLEPDACSLEEICELALSLVRAEARKKRIELTFQGPLSPVRFAADPRRLHQVLVNLLSNAVKFTPEEGRVDLVASADSVEAVIRLEVLDTGPGIAREDLPNLFRPFTQLDARLAREHGGSGLGLSLARGMAELHGGRIEVESEPGRGSRFSVVLPWRTLERRPPRPKETARKTPDTFLPARGRILLVEDDADNRTLLAEFLGAHGYALDTASTGREALEVAARDLHDLVILDIQLPGMDGLEVLRELRAMRSVHVPVLALTALAMVGDRDRILEAGADAYLSKPVAFGVLRAEIDRLLEGAPK